MCNKAHLSFSFLITLRLKRPIWHGEMISVEHVPVEDWILPGLKERRCPNSAYASVKESFILFTRSSARWPNKDLRHAVECYVWLCLGFRQRSVSTLSSVWFKSHQVQPMTVPTRVLLTPLAAWFTLEERGGVTGVALVRILALEAQERSRHKAVMKPESWTRLKDERISIIYIC